MTTVSALPYVAIRHLHPHPAQMRTVIGPEELAGLIISLKNNGWFPDRPLMVTRAPELGPAEYYIVRGHRRTLAWFLLQSCDASSWTSIGKVHEYLDKELLPEIPGGLIDLFGKFAETADDMLISEVVLLNEADAEQQALVLLADNFGGENPDIRGIIQGLNAARKAGASVHKISQAIGKSESWVRTRLNMLELSATIQGAVTDGTFSTTAAAAIARLDPERRGAADRYYAAMLQDAPKSWKLEAAEVQKRIKAFEEWQPPQLELSYAKPRDYWWARVVAALWASVYATDPGKAMDAAFEALNDYGSAAISIRLIEGLSGDEYITGQDYHRKINGPALMQRFAPEATCDACPLAALGKTYLKDDLSTERYPCRGGKPGPCLDAPLAPAPDLVEEPWYWNHRSSWLPVEQIIAQWQDQLAAQKQAPDDPSTQTEDGGVEASPVKRQRARIRHFMEHHEMLAATHPLATPCASCAFRTESSPVKSDANAPHCEWAVRMKDTGFFVRQPLNGLGQAIPVCRQYRRRNDHAWAARIPAWPSEPSLPRELLLRHIKDLAQDAMRQVYQAQRTVLESFTGRGMTKSESMKHAFEENLAAEQTNLTNRQLMTLLHWVLAEWTNTNAGYDPETHTRVGYPLLFDGQIISYRDTDWAAFWKEYRPAEALADEDTEVAETEAAVSE